MSPNDQDIHHRALLANAFHAFAAASERLEDAYGRLQDQLLAVQRDLAATSAERDTAQLQQAETARRLAALIEALPAGIVVLDGARVVREVNAAALTLLGEPLTGQAWTEILRRTSGTDAFLPGDLLLGDGRRLRITERPVDPEAGWILLVTDVTSQRKLEDVLARHRRLAAMGEMAATLAHQIRTPLSAALLYASNAANTALPGQRRADLLGRAMACLHDLEKLVSDMLDFARGAGASDTPVSVADILAAVETSAAALLRPGQNLQVGRCAEPLTVVGNREALVGAVLNLVTNALQAGGRAARVDISCATRGLRAELRVSDNGPGVPAGIRDRIFEPFFTSRPEGTGLGLAVVRSVAEAHGGEIRIGDNQPGGTCFSLWLPLAQNLPGLTAATAAPASTGNSREHQAA